jgi:hypothetical protein
MSEIYMGTVRSLSRAKNETFTVAKVSLEAQVFFTAKNTLLAQVSFEAKNSLIFQLLYF